MLRSRIVSSFFPLMVLSAATLVAAQQPAQPSDVDTAAEQQMRYSTADWQTIAPHLPDGDTAKIEDLQMAGDVLRARRFPDDAIRYYGYALKRGGDPALLLNRIGVTELEEGHDEAARVCFKRALALRRKYADGWNNLGAVESMTGNLRMAISDYQRAVKLNRKNAVYHANLGTAYLASRDYESSRQQFDVATALDAGVFRRGGFGGTMLHVLSTGERGRFGFEMARLAAIHGEDESVMHWLAVSVEAGFDINGAMAGLKEFAVYRKDLRIALLIKNANALHGKRAALAEPVPGLAKARD